MAFLGAQVCDADCARVYCAFASQSIINSPADDGKEGLEPPPRDEWKKAAACKTGFFVHVSSRTNSFHSMT